MRTDHDYDLAPCVLSATCSDDCAIGSRTEHLQEIIDAKLPLPSVNQCPYNPHLYSAQAELLAMCKKHNIVFNSYSPLGIPDLHKYLGQEHSLVQDPKLEPLAKKHGLSPAQILLAWQAGIGGMVRVSTQPGHTLFS